MVMDGMPQEHATSGVQWFWQQDELHVSNGMIALRFSSSGQLIGLANVRTGSEYLHPHGSSERSMPFKVTVKSQDQQHIRISPAAAQLTQLPQVSETNTRGVVITSRFTSFNADGTVYNLRIICTVRIEPSNAETFWSITIENRDPKAIVESVLFPYLHGVVLGDSAADDCLLFPYYAGIQIPGYISAAGTNQKQAPEGAVFLPNASPDDGLVFSKPYCGQASMAWLDIHDETNGLYLASYDPGLQYTDLMVMADPAIGVGGAAISKSVYLNGSGASWVSAEYALGIHNGNWHWSAHRYANWASRHMQRPRVPAWFRRRHALIAHYDFKWQDGTHKHTFTDIPQLYDRAVNDGVDHLFLAGWSSGGFDKLYPEYYPDLELGTMLDFAKGIRYARSKGGHVTLYINSALFGHSSQYAVTLGKKWSIKNADGSPLVRHFFHEDFYVNCRGVQEYQALMRDTVLFLVKSFGISGVYLDCFAAISPHLCFDSTHEHAAPTAWNHDAVQTVRKVEEGLREEAPDVWTMIEGCGDAFAQYVSAQLIHAWIVPEAYPEMYRYTFPEHCLVDMVYPSKGQTFRAPRISAQAYDQLYRTLVVGAYFWFYDQEDARYCNFRTDPAMWEEVQRCLSLRESVWPYFAWGRYCDTEGVQTSDPGVVAKMYILEPQMLLGGSMSEPILPGVLLAVWNRTGKKQSVTVDLAAVEKAVPGETWQAQVRALNEQSFHQAIVKEILNHPNLGAIDIDASKVSFIVLERM